MEKWGILCEDLTQGQASKFRDNPRHMQIKLGPKNEVNKAHKSIKNDTSNGELLKTSTQKLASFQVGEKNKQIRLDLP